MDELRMLADLLEENPSDRTAAEGRARLGQEIAAPARPERRRLRWPVFAGFGLAATAAAVTGTLVLSSGTTPRAPDPGPAAAPMTARTVLLAAAEKAEAAPATGRYWHTKSVDKAFQRVGPKNNPYWIEETQVSETWTERNGQQSLGFRSAGVRPATPADTAAWRRDGSPQRWPAESIETGWGGPKHLTIKPQPGLLVRRKETPRFGVCDKEMTFAQVAALPDEPTALRAALHKAMLNGDDGPVPPGSQQSFLTSCTAHLLFQQPVRPRTRAAAYRLLATMPGVKVLGRTVDQMKRPGIALVIDEGRTGQDTRFVIDTKTSSILQIGPASPSKPKIELTKRMGQVGTQISLEVGWTDAKPRIPTLP
ncbi:CU044_5270 family protein [Actinomadura kijaniata]|uniref:CU044_5270 family protein n=1 Tax=Actinomadura kijaniata TaxID=46161 RepID=UPI00082E0964|nr:CU044_5270 family protein [Actinomadura kijaniata]